MTDTSKKTRHWRRPVRLASVANLVFGALLLAFLAAVAVVFLRYWARS